LYITTQSTSRLCVAAGNGFERLDLHTVLWWVPVGHRPPVEEAQERLEHLRMHGATPVAFTFRQHFPSPDTLAEEVDDRWLCGV
jgi:hypothetical protein